MKHTKLVLGTAALAVTALATTGRARRAEREHPPRGRFVDVDGVRLHYLEQGSGPPVVLLHGNGTFAEDWRASGLLDQIAAHHRVVAIDRPGFGFSTRPRRRLWTPGAQAALLASTFDRLGLHEPVVVAHSIATQVAVALGLDQPARVRGLVLLGGYYYPTFRFDVPVLSPPAIPIVGDVMRYTISPLIGALILPRLERKMFGPMPVSERFRRDVPASLRLRPWQLRAAAEETAFMVPVAAALAPRVQELFVPVSVIAGADDRVVTTERQSARLADDVPGASLRVMPGIGHMVHHFAQDAILAAVTRAAGAPATARPA